MSANASERKGMIPRTDADMARERRPSVVKAIEGVPATQGKSQPQRPRGKRTEGNPQNPGHRRVVTRIHGQFGRFGRGSADLGIECLSERTEQAAHREFSELGVRVAVEPA